MDLTIKKNSKSRGKFFHKVPPGINCKEAKTQAIKDMGFSENRTREVRNYIDREADVLKSLEYDFEYIPIDQIDIEDPDKIIE